VGKKNNFLLASYLATHFSNYSLKYCFTGNKVER